MLTLRPQLLTLALVLVPPGLASAAAPTIFYTDIVTGPATGGEDDLGAYLTLFGVGFGATQSTSQVTINGIAVAAVKQWSDTKITVQPGPLVTSGAIRVTVVGQPSNADQAFAVVPGNIYFVALGGDDLTGQPNQIGQPYRTVNKVIDDLMVPGDHIVVRGGTWSDVYAQYGSFFSIAHKGGTDQAPVVVMGYPGETVSLVAGAAHSHGIHSFDTPGHFVVANFHVDANGHGVSIGLEPGTVDVRVVNNEVKNFFEDSGGAAAIDGSGRQYRIFGNLLHDNGGSKLYHGIYMDARDTSHCPTPTTCGPDDGPQDIEIAYNHIHHQTGGRGIQIYGDTSATIKDLSVHHNVIHDIHLDGIIFSSQTGPGFRAYDNLVYRTADPAMQGPSLDAGVSGGCIRFASATLVAEVYNNTLVDCALDGDPESAAIRFQEAAGITLRNNIVVTDPYYLNVGSMPGTLVASNNLWFGVGATPGFDSDAQAGDPSFENAGNADYHLRGGSRAIDTGSGTTNPLVTTDLDGIARPQGSLPDIGAYEFEVVCINGGDCISPPPCRTALGASCNNGSCVYPPNADGTACDDGNACTSGDACSSGVCAAGADTCNSSDPCSGATQPCDAAPAVGVGCGCRDTDPASALVVALVEAARLVRRRRA